MREGEIERVRQRYAPCFRRGDRLKLVRAEKFEEPRNKLEVIKGRDKGGRQTVYTERYTEKIGKEQ